MKALFLFVGFLLLPVYSFTVGQENVVVVVNSKSQESIALGNRYAELRKIPPCNVIYLDKITWMKPPEIHGTIQTHNLKKEILNPIFRTMRSRGIEKQIDYIAYSCDIPHRVDLRPEMHKFMKSKGRKYDPKKHSIWGAVTGATFLYERFNSPTPNVFDSNVNHYSGKMNRNFLSDPFPGEDQLKFREALNFINRKSWQQARPILEKLVANNPKQIATRIQLAVVLSALGENESAWSQLEMCSKLGLKSNSVITKRVKRLSSDSRWRKTFQHADLDNPWALPTRSFSAQEFWPANGWPNGRAGGGNRYILATMLAITGDKKSTLDQALEQIERSVAADYSNPKGTFYFAKHGDIRSKIRHRQIEFAKRELDGLGQTAVVDSDKWPQGMDNVVGATLGSPYIKWNQSNSRFAPGAICDNLTSYGAVWRKTQTHLTDYLHAGAAGASGTVFEPYAVTWKFPTARLQVHYARGCTLAESFYQTIGNPFQLMIVGDPLCRPFAVPPQFEVTGLHANDIVTSDFEIQISTPNAKNRFELYFDGVLWSEIPHSKNVKVPTQSIANGLHELRVVGIASGPIEVESRKIIPFQMR